MFGDKRAKKEKKVEDLQKFIERYKLGDFDEEDSVCGNPVKEDGGSRNTGETICLLIFCTFSVLTG